ncbi:hypothetical protein NMY22_g3295 [Coprinellus aureogranulatus]|nr:hypothetical protein NMY22_g3295 [Coprinellus aureogranulatus]
MAKSDGKKKPARTTVKLSTYAPATAFLGLRTPALADKPKGSVGRLQSKSLKCLLSGRGFKVQSQASASSINAGRAQAKPTILDQLKRWNGVAIEKGWDQGYIDSFIAKEILPPQEDTETGSKEREPGDPSIRKWLKNIDTFMSYIMMLEGRGRDPPDFCQKCANPNNPAVHRCTACSGTGLICRECMVTSHANTPLHRVERWTGLSFERISLKQLGLRIQLGHPVGEECRQKQPAKADDFVILDLDAVHEVGLDFCGCGKTNMDHVAQLVERRLFPATVLQPKTAATFRLLEFFEILQYESKISPFEVFTTLSRLANNTGLVEVKDRYPALIRMVHEWRHMKMIKRAGRAHDPHRPPSEMKEGECGLLCPPCPHPNINMAPGWEDEPEATRYLHALNIGLDANFRLKRKDVSNNVADPGLSRGYSYFVEDTAFRSALAPHKDDKEEKSNCSRHDAVNLADIRPGHGYAASGVGTVECTRHNMKRPSAVGDLQKGEKYWNMDYFLVRSIADVGLKMYLISYDIACQWSKKLRERVKAISDMCPLIRPDVVLRFVVPKFHLPAHIPACRSKYCFMLTRGAGLGDGEAPERGWGESNPLGPATREMGPGTRRDTLDFNFGCSLFKKLERATSLIAEQYIAHTEMESTQEPEEIQEWKAALDAWDTDPSNPNPFEFTVQFPTQASVRRELSEEESKAMDEGQDFSLTDEVSPSGLVAWGLDIEAEQRTVKKLSSQIWDHSQDRQLSRTQFRSNTLVRKIETWYRLLQLYIPGTALLRKRDATVHVNAFDLPLWLPLQIGHQVSFDRRLGEIEYRLRTAQAHEALGNMRRNLQIRATLYDVKKRWMRGQASNTRALKAIATVQGRISGFRDEYRKARTAILSLASVLQKEDHSKLFPALNDSDIQPMTEYSDGRSQTRKVLSWIWRMVGASDDMKGDFGTDTRRVEWGKPYARVQRYREEILLVKEEMRRTVRFFTWKETQWRRAWTAWEGHSISSEYAEGLRAYAERQGKLCRELRESFIQQWAGVDELVERAEAEIKNPDLYYERMGLSQPTEDSALPEVLEVRLTDEGSEAFWLGYTHALDQVAPRLRRQEMHQHTQAPAPGSGYGCSMGFRGLVPLSAAWRVSAIAGSSRVTANEAVASEIHHSTHRSLLPCLRLAAIHFFGRCALAATSSDWKMGDGIKTCACQPLRHLQHQPSTPFRFPCQTPHLFLTAGIPFESTPALNLATTVPITSSGWEQACQWMTRQGYCETTGLPLNTVLNSAVSKTVLWSSPDSRRGEYLVAIPCYVTLNCIKNDLDQRSCPSSLNFQATNDRECLRHGSTAVHLTHPPVHMCVQCIPTVTAMHVAGIAHLPLPILVSRVPKHFKSFNFIDDRGKQLVSQTPYISAPLLQYSVGRFGGLPVFEADDAYGTLTQPSTSVKKPKPTGKCQNAEVKIAAR